MRSWIRNLVLPICLVMIWQITSSLNIFSPYLLPSPLTTLDTAKQLFIEGLLLKHLLISLQRVFFGFILAALAAIPLGIICGRSNRFQNYVWPLLEFMRHIPPLAAIPLIILWFGIGEPSKLVIIFLASFFPLFLNTYSGIKNCDAKILEVGRSLHFSPLQQAKLIELPAALPAIAVGLQLSLGYSWRALIGAELIAASSGIGYMILDAEQMSRPDIVLVGILTIGIVGSVIDSVFFHLTNRLLPWNNVKGGDNDAT